jgi:predicted house-cleaning noncanonical NTP pyrophosphatase (MazG superfamily)
VKLVRDKIPNIIKDSGRDPDYYTALAPERIQRLFDKMREELDEFIEDPCLEEAADMYEVLLALCAAHELPLREVVWAAATKWEERGGFDDGIVLRESCDDDDEWQNYCAWG